MILPLIIGGGSVGGIILNTSSYIRLLMLLELLLTAGSLLTLHLGAENNLSEQGFEYLNSLTLLTLTGTEAVIGLSLLVLGQLRYAPLYNDSNS